MFTYIDTYIYTVYSQIAFFWKQQDGSYVTVVWQPGKMTSEMTPATGQCEDGHPPAWHRRFFSNARCPTCHAATTDVINTLWLVMTCWKMSLIWWKIFPKKCEGFRGSISMVGAPTSPWVVGNSKPHLRLFLCFSTSACSFCRFLWDGTQ